MDKNGTVWHRFLCVSHVTKVFNSLPQKLKLLKLNACTITTDRGTDLGLIGQCYLTFRLGNKYFMDKFIILPDLHRDLTIGPTWQFSYKIGGNWNIDRHQYITHKNDYFCTGIPLEVKKHHLKCRSILSCNPGVVVTHNILNTNRIKFSPHLSAWYQW